MSLSGQDVYQEWAPGHTYFRDIMRATTSVDTELLCMRLEIGKSSIQYQGRLGNQQTTY